MASLVRLSASVRTLRFDHKHYALHNWPCSVGRSVASRHSGAVRNLRVAGLFVRSRARQKPIHTELQLSSALMRSCCPNTRQLSLVSIPVNGPTLREGDKTKFSHGFLVRTRSARNNDARNSCPNIPFRACSTSAGGLMMQNRGGLRMIDQGSAWINGSGGSKCGVERSR